MGTDTHFSETETPGCSRRSTARRPPQAAESVDDGGDTPASRLCHLLWIVTFVCVPAFAGQVWEGPLLKPAPREEVFEFTKRPTFRNVGTDRYEIAFAVKGNCDVAVAIHDGKGKIVRHIAAGVLGANAPEPLAKHSLGQKLIWDGKDDFGEYVEKPLECAARVSLGLSPKWDKLIGWHTHDMTGGISGIGADADGVYVLNASSRNQIKKFDHDGNYVRTVYPWPADTFNSGKVLGIKKVAGPDGHGGPPLGMFGGKIMIGSDASGLIYSSLPVHKGRMLCTTRGYRHTKHLVCIGTDGTSGGEPTMKATLPRKRGLLWGSQEIAVSPDGKWIYFTGLGARNDDGWNVVPTGDWSASKHVGERCRHAVYRMGWAEKGPVGQPFIGEENLPQHARGKDNRHFDFPTGIACDSKGRIYVSDHGNNRIQVFSTEPKHLKTIKCDQPWQLAVHPKTGEIYVHCYPNRPGRRSKSKFQATLVKFGGFDNPRKVKEWAIPSRGKEGGPPRPLFCLDAWTTPTRVWLTNYGAVQVYEETDKGFDPLLSFPEKVRKDGFTPGCMGRSYRNRLAAVPDSYLYLSRGKTAHGTTRVDPEEGKRFQRVYEHWTGTFEFDELIAAPDGFLYVRGVPWVARMREPTFPFEGGVSFTPDDEIPFDYGEVRKGGFSHSYAAWAKARGRDTGRSRQGTVFRGVVPIPSVPGGNYENMGVNVSSRGHIVAFAKVYGRVLEYKDRKELGLNEVAMKQYLEFVKNNAGFAPKLVPGVLSGGEIVFTYDIRGEPLGEALIAGPVGSCGIAVDKDGNLYVGVGVAPYKPAPFAYGGRSGVVCKFPPAGGKIYGNWGPLGIKGDSTPKRPPEFTCAPATNLWSRNMYWSFPGVGQITPSISPGCTCPQSRFHVDLYSRLFAPMAWRFCVAVLDTNGNPVTYVGRYGNADSGRGPESPVKVKGGVATAHCSFIAIVSDRWLYMMDSGNNRIVRVKLDYAVEEKIALQK